MTSAEYREAREMLTNSDICDFADRMCKKEKINPITDYPQKTGSSVMISPARRHMYLVRAIELLRRMIFLGATNLEILRASEYLMVISNSIDHSLDYKECEISLKIRDLSDKYSQQAFFDSGLVPSDLKDIIKRDKEYYSTSIKKED